VHYLLPLKADPGADLTELAAYVRRVGRRRPVIVVDGSDPATFARNAELFAGVTHVKPNPELDCANGKVAGVLTGLALCAGDKVVVADDDVRYESAELDRLERLLDDADVVSPQNYYRPMPWPAWWDSARIVINRALPAGDYPGTLGLRLSGPMRELGYDGDVLFENLELIRSVRADGGRALVARDLFVRRRPPEPAHFLGQRVRQAYDSQAQPLRLAVELSLLPLAVLGPRHRAVPCALLMGGLGLAEIGRRRAGAGAHFPPAVLLFVPIWLAERALCAWVALGRRALAGGTRFAGRRIKRAATPVGRLHRQRAGAGGSRRRTA
jgi:hypothetical protein